MVLLAYPGAMACRAAPEAVESRVPVSPAKPTMANLYVPAVTADACVLFPEQPVADRLDEPSQPAGSRALDLVFTGTDRVTHRTSPFAYSEPDSAPGWADAPLGC